MNNQDPSTGREQVPRKQNWIYSLFLIGGLFALCSLFGRDRSRQQIRAVPAEPVPCEQPYKAHAPHSIRGRYLILQLTLALLSFGSGAYCLRSTATPSFESAVSDKQALHIWTIFDTNAGYTDADFEGVKGSNVIIFIRPIPQSQNVEVSFSIRDRQELQVGKTGLRAPRFEIEWPGIIEFSGTAREVHEQAFKIQHTSIGTTLVESHYPYYPDFEFTWFNAVESNGPFAKRIGLRVADYVSSSSRASESLAYTIRVNPSLPDHIRILYQRPATTEDIVRGNEEEANYIIPVGITTQETGSVIRTVTYAASNFELIFEPEDAEQKRSYLVLIAGILLGVGGNFLANFITELATPSRQ